MVGIINTQMLSLLCKDGGHRPARPHEAISFGQRKKWRFRPAQIITPYPPKNL